jgi:hypothetical protein
VEKLNYVLAKQKAAGDEMRAGAHKVMRIRLVGIIQRYSDFILLTTFVALLALVFCR